MAQRTTLVSNRIHNGKEVVAAARTHRDAIAAALAAKVAGWSEERARGVLETLADHLDAHTRGLAGAEDRYVAEQADDPPLRDRRDRAAAALLDLSVRARSRIEDALGASGLERYGFEGPTPRHPGGLASHVENTVNLLRSEPAEVDDGLGGRFRTTALADRLAAALAPLRDALEALRVEGREHEAAITERDRALAAWTEAYQGVAGTLVGLFRLAGRADLAARIRPTERRASGRDVAAPVDEPTEPAPPDAPSPPEAE
jgi:hypothetical protein